MSLNFVKNYLILYLLTSTRCPKKTGICCYYYKNEIPVFCDSVYNIIHYHYLLMINNCRPHVRSAVSACGGDGWHGQMCPVWSWNVHVSRGHMRASSVSVVTTEKETLVMNTLINNISRCGLCWHLDQDLGLLKSRQTWQVLPYHFGGQCDRGWRTPVLRSH